MVIITAVSAAIAAVFIKRFSRSLLPKARQFVKELSSRWTTGKPLRPEYREPLIKYFRFYHTLSDKDKQHFERRVQKFIHMKEFIARGELRQVTAEMKALIAATAIQITFGYPRVYFSHFWRILVYQDNYYSEITQKYHQGEVNLRGLIVLSWKSFVQGFVEHDSGKNLGYHEMAHALRFENAIANKEYGYLDDRDLQHFTALAHTKINSMREGVPSLLRSYAATNTHEFFAVVIENFFERPSEFFTYDPELYKATVRIMKQDPLLDVRH